MPLQLCLERGCENLVVRGRCAAHQQARNAAKNAQPHRWVYRDRRWFECRRVAIRQAGHRCQVVENGRRCTVTDRAGARLHGHHNYVGGVQQMLRDGVDPFDPHYVVVSCTSHHARIESILREQQKAVKGRRGR